MSFYYVNPGFVQLFNYVTDDNSIEQINSSIHNPSCGVACTSSKDFGYFFNETISEISGCFSLYVSSSMPNYNVFKLNFYNLSDISSTLNYPIISLCGYPDGSVLNNSHFPLTLSVGQLNVYNSSDIDKCPKVAFVNKIWFRISVDSTKIAIFQLKVNDNPVYSYTLELNNVTLGNTLTFSLNDASVSNILLSSSYDKVSQIANITPVNFSVSETDMLVDGNDYIANGFGQKTSFNVLSSNYDDSCSDIFGFVFVKQNVSSEDNCYIFVDQEKSYQGEEIQSHTEYNIENKDVIIFSAIKDADINYNRGDYTFIIGVDS